MDILLMHKNIEVARVVLDNGSISNVKEVLTPKHMPIGTYLPTMGNRLCTMYLQAWQRSRVIPNDRTNLSFIMKETDKSIFQLSELSHGMALTDQYWFRDVQKNTRWEEINFHNNGFPESSLTLLGYGKVTASPDFTTNGSLPKSWILLDQVPTLLKDSPSWLPTASANEVIASRIAQLCGIDHAMYDPIEAYGKVFCATPCFIDSDAEEFVSLQQYKRIIHMNLEDTARQIGLNQQYLERLTSFDRLVGNTDRHEGNFGVIIDPDTMSFIRPAPLFDSGTCLERWTGNPSIFKPFYENRDAAIKSLSKVPFSLPNKQLLKNIVYDVYNIFHVEQYAKQAVEELIDNANSLDITKERHYTRIEEDDLCL